MTSVFKWPSDTSDFSPDSLPRPDYRIIASVHRDRADRKLTNPITVTLSDF